MSNYRSLLVTLALAAAALLFWQSRVVAPATETEGFFQTDFYTLLYPMYHYGYGELAAGRLPLWNPFALCGLPFLATLYTGILYPGNFLFLLLPTALAMGMTAALHAFLASWFMYLLGREWGWSRSAAAVAAVAWGYSHNSVWFYGPICFLASAAWLPLMALGVERACAGRGRGGAAILALAGAMSLLAGGFQTFVYGAYALALFALVRLALVLRRRGARAAGGAAAWLLFAALTAGAFAAPQILPTAQLSAMTERSIQGLPPEWTANPMAPPSGPAVEAAAPTGGEAVPSARSQQASLGERVLGALADLRTLVPRRIPALYLGILPPLLAVAALVGPQWRVALALATAGLAALALSMGPETPLYGIYYRLPTGDWFRNANRFVFLAAFVISIMAGLGLRSLAASRAHRRRGLAAAGAAALAGILLVALEGAPTDVLLLSGGVAILGLLLAAGVTGAPPALRSVAGPALALLVFGELWLAYANPYYHPQKNPEVFREHGAMTRYLREHLGSGRIAVVDNPWGSWAIQRKYGTLNRLRTLNDFEPLVPVRYKLAFSLLENSPPSGAAPFDGALWLDPSRSSKKILDMLAVRYVLVDRGLYPPWDAGARAFGLRRVLLPDPTASLYANPGARPRASLVPAAVRAAGEREAAAVLARHAFDPARLAVVEPPMTGGSETAGAALLPAAERPVVAPAAPMPAGDARILRDAPERVEIEVRVPEGPPRWLVLMDLPFPGWRATVDGEPAPIRPANLVGRAVALAPGTHSVVFTYVSRPFWIGLSLLVAAALAWGALSIPRGPGTRGFPLRRMARRFLPWIVAILILWVLFARTGLASVREAAAEANLLLLFGATVLCTLPMYALDVLALSRSIGWFNRRVPLADLARVKAASYLITLVNYNVGTGAIALWLKRRRRIPFLEATASVLFINVVDVTVLLGLLAATIPLLDPPMDRAIGGLVAVGALLLAGHFLYWRAGVDFLILGRLRRWPIFKSFRLATAGHYLRIAAIRLPFDLLFILNFWLALLAFGVKVHFGLVLAYVPLILFIAVVPVTVAGLGTVQAATLYLFRDHAPEATLLAFSLMLTVALSAVRALLGIPFFRRVSLEIFSGGIVEADGAEGGEERVDDTPGHST